MKYGGTGEKTERKGGSRSRSRGTPLKGPNSHWRQGRSWRLFAAPLGHDARLVSGRQVLYNTELGNGGRVEEDVREGKIQKSYKTGTGQARRAEGSRVITVPCLIKA